MQTIHVDVHEGYDVLLGEGILTRTGSILRERWTPRAVAVVTDETVDRLYGEAAAAAIAAAGFTVHKFVFAPGEHHKTLETFGKLLNFLAAEQLTKSDIVLALGGGIVGDVAGFAASAYLRGLFLVQMPTTLLAMVDSSVGGKTAVNLEAGKNLAGAFYQPHLVLADTGMLTSLPPEFFGDGAAEIIKYGVLCGGELFADLAAGNLKAHLPAIIARSVEIKRDYVRGDEFDKGARQFLNLGHTIGHAVEKTSAFAITHGHAVAIGMAAAARGACARGICSAAAVAAISETLARYSLPVKCPFTAAQLLSAALNDKKRRGGEITLVLPHAVGDCKLHKIPIEELAGFLTAAAAN